jgi:hypothetical protein
MPIQHHSATGMQSVGSSHLSYVLPWPVMTNTRRSPPLGFAALFIPGQMQQEPLLVAPDGSPRGSVRHDSAPCLVTIIGHFALMESAESGQSSLPEESV